MMSKFFKLGLLGAVFAASAAHASLTPWQTVTGSYGVSTDGWGSTSQSGVISATVPAGATVVSAYLYTSTYFGFAGAGGTFGGTAVSYTSLGANNVGLEAGRANVTSIVSAVVDGGPGGVYNFNITETSAGQDGSALVVVYLDPTLGTSTVAILDGFSATTGDSTAINFASPLDPSVAGFGAEMRLGIGFSYDGDDCTGSGQSSRVTVNSTIITQNAGCNEDSADAVANNGNLITVGGSDDPFSALLPSVAADHERYNLVPYISAGDSTIAINTLNPSNNDNIFLAVFRVSGRASINEPPTGVPEPLTLGLVGLGLGLIGAQQRRKRRTA